MIQRETYSFLSDAMAMHESALRELLSDVARVAAAGKRPAAAADMPDMARLEDYLPTVNELIVGQGVAVVPIHGLMVKRSQIIDGWSGSRLVIGMDFWSEVIAELTNRNDVTDIVIDFETGGGQVAGTQRLGDAVYLARQSKNVIGVANETAASAGLWVLSQCSRVVVPATGNLGSLGVYTLHIDDTKFLSDFGMEKTVIHRGKYKAVGERALDADSKADMQRWIDAKYSLFVDAVARGRGVDAAEVITRWGDSRLFSGSEAASNGLADELGTLQDVLESLRAGRGGRVSISVPPADPDPEGDTVAMKLNASGQVMDTAGKVVGNLSDLQIDAAGLTKHFAGQTNELIESAVNTAKAAATETAKADLAAAIKKGQDHLKALQTAVGADKAIDAFIAGDSVEKAKAGLADDLSAALKAKDEEIEKLKAAGSSRTPGFVASDAKTGDAKAGEKAADRSEFAADWDADKGGCQAEFGSEKLYAAYRRHKG